MAYRYEAAKLANNRELFIGLAPRYVFTKHFQTSYIHYLSKSAFSDEDFVSFL